MMRLLTKSHLPGKAVSLCQRHFLLFSLFTLLPFYLASCSMIDEDQSDCGVQADVNYELRLVTNINTEIETKLTTKADLQIAELLRGYLMNVFTDFAHDVDLSFYDTIGDSVRLQHDKHIMDANQASYTLHLPKREYMHLAAANILDNELVSLTNDEHCHPSMLRQVARDTINSHDTGLFTARLPMNVLEGSDQNFTVRLYMANCAACLVIDPRGFDTEDIKVFATGFATGFHICDSAFVFPEKSPIVTTTRLKPKDGSEEVGFCCVTFPSKEPSNKGNQKSPTRTVIETEEPFIAQPGDETLWEFRVYVPQKDPNGTRSGSSITESLLQIKKPQRAGEVTIIKVYVGDKGNIVSESQEVAVSVTLDWKPGNTYEPVL